MFSFKALKPVTVNTRPEITVKNKIYIISVFPMPQRVCNNTFFNVIRKITSLGGVIE